MEANTLGQIESNLTGTVFLHIWVGALRQGDRNLGLSVVGALLGDIVTN